MSLDGELPLTDMIYLNFLESALQQHADQLHFYAFYLLKCEVKYEEWCTKFILLLFC